jgi:hypothetical protein
MPHEWRRASAERIKRIGNNSFAACRQMGFGEEVAPEVERKTVSMQIRRDHCMAGITENADNRAVTGTSIPEAMRKLFGAKQCANRDFRLGIEVAASLGERMASTLRAMIKHD